MAQEVSSSLLWGDGPGGGEVGNYFILQGGEESEVI